MKRRPRDDQVGLVFRFACHPRTIGETGRPRRDGKGRRPRAGGWVTASHGSRGTALAALVCCAIALPVGWATRFLAAPSARAAHDPAQAPSEEAAPETRTPAEPADARHVEARPAGLTDVCCGAEAALVNCRVSGRAQLYPPGHMLSHLQDACASVAQS